MTSRKAQRDELLKNAITLPNIKGRMRTKKERDEYFRFIRAERLRLGKDPSANVIAALHQADKLLKDAENHSSKKDIQKSIDAGQKSFDSENK